MSCSYSGSLPLKKRHCESPSLAKSCEQMRSRNPAIVRDHPYAAGELEQRVLECAQRFDVEVFRWLVEQEEVAIGDQRLLQVQPSALAARELAEEFLLVGALAVEAADGRHVPARARRSNGRTAAIRHGAPAVATRSTRAIPRRAGTPTNDVPAALPSTSAGHRSTAAATAATPRAVAAESLLAARAPLRGRRGQMHTRPRSICSARRGNADSRPPHQPLARKRAAR